MMQNFKLFKNYLNKLLNKKKVIFHVTRRFEFFRIIKNVCD